MRTESLSTVKQVATGPAANGAAVADMKPVVRFCRTPKGADLAHAALGHGPPLVLLPGWLGHLLERWSHPAADRALRNLTSCHEVHWFDRLGCGLSSRLDGPPSLDCDIQQLLCVTEASGLDRVSLVGHSLGCAAAVAFAADYPERVSRLVLCSPFLPDCSTMSSQQFALLKQILLLDWELGSRIMASMLVPDGDSRDLRWFSHFLRRSCGAKAAAALLDHLLSVDVLTRLPELRMPTLVIHNREDELVPPEAAEQIAALAPDVHLHALDGNDHDLFIRRSDCLVNAVLDFCAGRKMRSTALAGESGRSLSHREREVLCHIAAGESNKRIAIELGIAVSTVERHVTNIYSKLGARSRADAAVRAVAMNVTSSRLYA